ncbi:hypothetical protein [Streptomyces sp. NPDC093089]|uniref:hypothetical protein n=1 Tax=Streptomyces sp. NPDC093089 TaxID=3366024 RepID=UPI00381A1A81
MSRTLAALGVPLSMSMDGFVAGGRLFADAPPGPDLTPTRVVGSPRVAHLTYRTAPP